MGEGPGSCCGGGGWVCRALTLNSSRKRIWACFSNIGCAAVFTHKPSKCCCNDIHKSSSLGQDQPGPTQKWRVEPPKSRSSLSPSHLNRLSRLDRWVCWDETCQPVPATAAGPWAISLPPLLLLQVIQPTDDGKAFDMTDAQLELSKGTPRSAAPQPAARAQAVPAAPSSHSICTALTCCTAGFTSWTCHGGGCPFHASRTTQMSRSALGGSTPRSRGTSWLQRPRAAWQTTPSNSS